MIYNVEFSYTVYVKANSEEEAEKIAETQHRFTEPDVVTQRVRPGDYVDPNWKIEAPCSKQGDRDCRDIGQLLEEERLQGQEAPTTAELEAAGQLTLEDNTQ